ncbi:MAG: iron-containing alcohol dehydrogenase [Dehalococcoidales bacterium]
MSSTYYKPDKISSFYAPNKLIFGLGSANQAGKEARNLGGSRALVVTDKQVVSAGLVEEVLNSLREAGLDPGVFDRVEAEPPLRNVDDGASTAREGGYDIIIGVGGGSSLDVAKGTALLATLEGSVDDYIGTDVVPSAGLPKILMPTTAGTGSEVTRVLVVTDETDHVKKVIYSDFALADVAIVDPRLTLSMPSRVTADSGTDALVHAVESNVSMNATPFSDILSLEAIRLIGANLAAAYSEPDNIEARYNMSLAATLAGMSFASGGLGANHALSYPLGTDYHLSHGRSNAVMLPYIVDYNRQASPGKYAAIARTLGLNVDGLSVYEAGERLVEYLENLMELLGISIRLSSYGVTADDIPGMVEKAMKQDRFFVPNPRYPTDDDVREIYQKAL